MAAFGLTSTGLNIKTLSVIESEIDDSLKTSFGTSINTLPESVFGQLKTISAERLSLAWELLEAIYNSQYGDTAFGNSLIDVLALTGLVQLAAKKSKITGQLLFGTVSTVIPKGTVFSVLGSPTITFETTEAVTLIAGTDEVQTITFSSVPTSGTFQIVFDGQTTVSINFSGTANDVQNALRALSNLTDVTVTGDFTTGFVVTFTGVDGLQPQNAMTTTANSLSDGGAITITITETIAGVAQGSVIMEATETGAKAAAANLLTVIDNPVSGLVSTTNPTAAVLGRDLETDAEMRARKLTDFQVSLSGPIEAIRSKVLTLNDDTSKISLDSVLVFENSSEVTVGSRPPKSVEVVVFENGGTTTRDQDIADAIFVSKSGGIRAFGTVSKTVVDSQGFSHTVSFSRPVQINIYLEIDVTVNSSYPVNGDTQVSNTLVTWGNGLGQGVDVVVFPTLIAQLNDISGIVDIVIRIGTAPSPTQNNNIPIDNGSIAQVEISRWAASRITVTQV